MSCTRVQLRNCLLCFLVLDKDEHSSTDPKLVKTNYDGAPDNGRALQHLQLQADLAHQD